MSNETKCCSRMGGGAPCLYGMAFIGAVIYYLQHATDFWTGVLAVLKAIVWPVLLVHKLLEFLQM